VGGGGASPACVSYLIHSNIRFPLMGVSFKRVNMFEENHQTFTGIAIFRLVLHVSLSIFRCYAVFRLHAKLSEKNNFFRFKAIKKSPYFRLFSL
jgi:hypothetical protein